MCDIMQLKDGDKMQADYENWVPRGMCIGLWLGTIIVFILFVIFGICRTN